jgi:hypothetical protein
MLTVCEWFGSKTGGDSFLQFGLKTSGDGFLVWASKPCGLGYATKLTEGGRRGTRVKI